MAHPPGALRPLAGARGVTPTRGHRVADELAVVALRLRAHGIDSQSTTPAGTTSLAQLVAQRERLRQAEQRELRRRRAAPVATSDARRQLFAAFVARQRRGASGGTASHEAATAATPPHAAPTEPPPSPGIGDAMLDDAGAWVGVLCDDDAGLEPPIDDAVEVAAAAAAAPLLLHPPSWYGGSDPAVPRPLDAECAALEVWLHAQGRPPFLCAAGPRPLPCRVEEMRRSLARQLRRAQREAGGGGDGGDTDGGSADTSAPTLHNDFSAGVNARRLELRLEAALGVPAWRRTLLAHAAATSSGVAGTCDVPCAPFEFLAAVFEFGAACDAADGSGGCDGGSGGGGHDLAAAIRVGADVVARYLSVGSRCPLAFLPAPLRASCADAFHAAVERHNFHPAAAAVMAVVGGSNAWRRFQDAGGAFDTQLALALRVPRTPVAAVLALCDAAAPLARSLVTAQACARGWLARHAAARARRGVRRSSGSSSGASGRRTRSRTPSSTGPPSRAPPARGEPSHNATPAPLPRDAIDYFATSPPTAYGYVVPPGATPPLAGLRLPTLGERAHATALLQRVWRGYAGRRTAAAVADARWAPVHCAAAGRAYYVRLRDGATTWVLPRCLPEWALTPKLWCSGVCGGSAVACAVCVTCAGLPLCDACVAAHCPPGAAPGTASPHVTAPYTPGDAVCDACGVRRAGARRVVGRRRRKARPQRCGACRGAVVAAGAGGVGDVNCQ